MTFAHALELPRNLHLAERIFASLAALRARYAKHRAYLALLDELEAMSERELADLNISRLSLRDIARTGIYGA